MKIVEKSDGQLRVIGRFEGLGIDEEETYSLHRFANGRIGVHEATEMVPGELIDVAFNHQVESDVLVFRVVKTPASYVDADGETKTALSRLVIVEVVKGPELLDECPEFTRCAA